MPELVEVWDAELSYTHTPLMDTPGPVPAHADGAEPLWCVYQYAPATQMEIHHALPHTLFEWRAAMHGIDPDDTATLLDVALHEPYLPAADDMFASDDPSAASVLAETRGLPTWQTPGVPDADRLAACLAQIEAVKTHRVRLEAAPLTARLKALVYVGSDRALADDPLEPVTSLMRLDPVRVQARRQAVEWVRAGREAAAAAGRGLIVPTFHGPKPAGTFVGMQPRPGGSSL
ncbi:hypothetical protein [Nonomuraea wenchangensis]|uniref:Uncharacterized protein n=1 Tax=Nonomuraea wenchangensis TaxID=568860 RepID=A0A1I0LWH3_9ACTN|nr:hypothetical protein [Nonomuraea wenchangensis]SEU46642.1 hypothetical protein SAMN05421811_127103 [Nonomuraea wenchangensis]